MYRTGILSFILLTLQQLTEVMIKKNSSDSVVSMIPQISTQRCQLPPRSLTQQCRDTAELDLAVSVAPRSLTALTSQSRYNFLVFV